MTTNRSASENFDDSIVEDIMAAVKQNSKALLKDLSNGIDMYRLAANILVGFGIVMLAYTYVFISVGYFDLGKSFGVLSAAVNFAASGTLLAIAYYLRKKYGEMKKRHSALLVLSSKLGVY